MAFSQSGFYTGNGGDGKVYLVETSVLSNGAADGSDKQLPSRVKETFINGVAGHSAIKIADVAEAERSKNAIARSEGNEYETSLDVSFLQSDMRLNIETTRLADGKYIVTVSVTKVGGKQGNQRMAGAIETEPMSLVDVQLKGGAIAAMKFLEGQGVKLTAAGKNDLVPGSVVFDSKTRSEEISMRESSINSFNEMLAQANKELERLASANSLDARIVEERKRAEAAMQAAEFKLRREQELLEEAKRRAEAEREAEQKRAEMNEVHRAQFDEAREKAEAAALELRLSAAQTLSAPEKIVNIEVNKQTLDSFWKEIKEQIVEYNAEEDKALMDSIADERNALQASRGKVFDSDGFLTEERYFNAFINSIKPKQEASERRRREFALNQASTADSFKSEIANLIKDLESQSYTADSLLPETGLFISFSSLDTNKNEWKYDLLLSLGNDSWKFSGTISYYELTGKKPPRDGADMVELDEWYDNYTRYDMLFGMGTDILQAKLKYKVRVGESSRYQVEIQELVISDIGTGKKIKSEKVKGVKRDIQYTPAVNVNLMTAQEIFAAKQNEKKSIDRTLSLIGYGKSLVSVSGGSFLMGRNYGDNDEKPVHMMDVDDFEMLATEVPVSLYRAIMGKNPTSSSDERVPVTNISKFDAMDFCNALSKRCGLVPAYTLRKNSNGNTTYTCDFTANGFRLPTETEWEYAALGGIYSAEYTVANPKKIPDGWNKTNSGAVLHPVAGKNANSLGLFDMVGNAYEWCWDIFSKESYQKARKYGVGYSEENKNTVIRGGSFKENPQSPFFRNSIDGNGKNYEIGFRVVRPVGLDVEVLYPKTGASITSPAPSSVSSSSTPSYSSRGSSSPSYSSSDSLSGKWSDLSSHVRVSDAFGIGYNWIGNKSASFDGLYVYFTSLHRGPFFVNWGDISYAGSDDGDFFNIGSNIGLYKGIKRLFIFTKAGVGFYYLGIGNEDDDKDDSSSSSTWDSNYDPYANYEPEDAFGVYFKWGLGAELKISDHFKAVFGYDVYFLAGSESKSVDSIRLGICFGQPVNQK